MKETTPGGEPFRFLVMGDPQFRVPRPGIPAQTWNLGYEWPNDVWRELPRIMRRLGAHRLFVCGDIFEYLEGDGTTVGDLWDVWDAYAATFDDGLHMDWVTGGHEWLRGPCREGDPWVNEPEPRDYFLQRYPERVRYVVRDGRQAFILFDNTHEFGVLKPGALEWLDAALESCQDLEHVWFFGHVPPWDPAYWWPQEGEEYREELRSDMAALLTAYGVRGAFFGHLHRDIFLGEPGGFPLFVTGREHPLLVEVCGGDVSFRWIMDPLSADPAGSAVAPMVRMPADG